MKPTLSSLVVVAAFAAVPALAQEQNLEEVAAYMAFYGPSSTGETEKALTAAQEYLAKFPDGQNAEYVRKWLTGHQWTQFNEAVKAKDMAAMIKIGRAGLASVKDPSFAYWMAWYLRQTELLGAAEAVHVAEAKEFSSATIDFVEKGGVATGIDAAKWNKDANLAWLHQNLALVATKQDQPQQALEHYATSSKLAPQDAALNARNQLGCASLHKSLYDGAVARYQALPEAERAPEGPSDAAKQAIEAANRHADDAIECWARFLAGGSGSGELRSRIEAAIGALYAYRHPEEPEGWKGLVEKLKGGA